MTLDQFRQGKKCPAVREEEQRAWATGAGGYVMKLVYCCDPLDTRTPDEAYAAEAAAADRLGIPYFLVSYEALVNDSDPARAVRRVAPQGPPSSALYRGWMLTPERYRQLYEALAARGVHLINDPAAYHHCHYLPESYPVIERHTPRSVWKEVRGPVAVDQIMELLRPFGAAPVVVKDYVKSRKHEWDEACFIPSAANRAAVERVVRRFLELQGEDLNVGLVFREYVEFEPLATHSRSGMPLTREFRLFFLDGRVVYWAEYWEEGDYGGLAPPADRFREVAGAVRSRFFTMDVARRRGGDWMIVELGDGQVAGLPERADPEAFYRALRDNWPPRLSAGPLSPEPAD